MTCLCTICNNEITKKNGKYCSLTCLGIGNARRNAQNRETVTCLNCSVTFEVIKNAKRKKKFCCQSCRATWYAKNDPTVAQRINAPNVVRQYAHLLGEKNGMFGQHHNVLSRALMSFRRKGISSYENLDDEQTQILKKKRHDCVAGENNPMFGRKAQGYASCRGICGYYKTRFFRSLFELSFMKYLEESGISLDDVLYEEVKIPYEFDDKKRTYITDFYIPSQRTVYEIKPQWEVDTQQNIAKFEAARLYCDKNGLKFLVMTENNFHIFKKSDFECTQDVKFVSTNDKEIQMAGLRLTDSVLIRIINIFQESILLGQDASDEMRRIELMVDEQSPNTLLLTPEYEQSVTKYHKDLLIHVEELKQQRGPIINPDAKVVTREELEEDVREFQRFSGHV